MKFDVNEAIAIVGLVAVAIGAMYYFGVESKDIVLSIGAGLVGYVGKGAVGLIQK